MTEEEEKAFYPFTQARENEEGPGGALIPTWCSLEMGCVKPLASVGRREGRGSGCDRRFQCWKHWCCSGVLNHSRVETSLCSISPCLFYFRLLGSGATCPRGVYLAGDTCSDIVELELP